jgi:nucleotide-binding universal stress UspA family protein
VPGMTADMFDATRVAAEQVVASVRAQLTLPTTMRVDSVVELAPPAALLCRVAETADVVVIGVHHFNLVDQLLTGPVASPVAAEAACPVVVVPRGWSRTLTGRGSIFVALDGETSATPALDFAFDEAERLRSGVTALHAERRSARPDFGTDPRTGLAEIVAGHQQAHPDIVVRTLVLPGDPAQVIIHESSAADMVVVGRPHRQRHGSWTRSVARAVLDQSNCPLVIVPPQPIREPVTGDRRQAGLVQTGEPSR